MSESGVIILLHVLIIEYTHYLTSQQLEQSQAAITQPPTKSVRTFWILPVDQSGIPGTAGCDTCRGSRRGSLGWM
eukprot:1384174-Amorphochlora_amoeboformis.AAC.1